MLKDGFISITARPDKKGRCRICNKTSELSIEIVGIKREYFCKFCANAISSSLKSGIDLANLNLKYCSTIEYNINNGDSIENAN